MAERRLGTSDGFDTVLGLWVAQFPFDAAATTVWGLAGRAYGLRDGRRTDLPRKRRSRFIASGVPLVVAGAATIVATSFFLPLQMDWFSYEYAAVRHAAVLVVSAGAALVGYGQALPRPHARDSLAALRGLRLRPVLSTSSLGIAVMWHR